MEPAARIFVTLCVCVLCTLTGCAAPIAFAATAGLGAAEAGASAWVRGELREAVYIDLEQVHHAALLAICDLEVDILTDRLGERSAFISAMERRGPEIRITMVRRTPRLTRIGIRVGFMGDLATSKVVMERIHAHLPTRGSHED